MSRNTLAMRWMHTVGCSARQGRELPEFLCGLTGCPKTARGTHWTCLSASCLAEATTACRTLARRLCRTSAPCREEVSFMACSKRRLFVFVNGMQ